MADLFYCPKLDRSPAALDGAEAHHAIHVLRVKAGDAIDLFDGEGRLARGVIESISRREVHVRFESVAHAEFATGFEVTVAAAVPKGDRLKWMVEKLTELGVDRFVPLETERSVIRPGGNKLDKLKSTIISAAKQSRNLRLMKLCKPATLHDVIADAESKLCLIAHPGSSFSESTEKLCPQSATILIGPEGGFTDTEVEQACQRGCLPMGWPSTILRIETAAVVFAAMIKSRFEETSES